jgi:hypothetical protein
LIANAAFEGVLPNVGKVAAVDEYSRGFIRNDRTSAESVKQTVVKDDKTILNSNLTTEVEVVDYNRAVRNDNAKSAKSKICIKVEFAIECDFNLMNILIDGGCVNEEKMWPGLLRMVGE